MSLKTKILFFFVFSFLFGSGCLFLGNKTVQAAASDPVNVNVFLHDSTGNPITNGNVALVLGPQDAATSCSYAGKSSSWTGTYGPTGVYIFNNGGSQLQVCGNLQTYVINAMAAGFLAASVNAYPQIHGSGGSTVIIDIQLSQPSAGAITQVSVNGSVSGTATVSNAISGAAGSSRALLLVGVIGYPGAVTSITYSINGGPEQPLQLQESHAPQMLVAYYYKALGNLAANTSISVHVAPSFTVIPAIYSNVDQVNPFVSQTNPAPPCDHFGWCQGNYAFTISGVPPVNVNTKLGSVVVALAAAIPNDKQTVTGFSGGPFDFSSIPGPANSLNSVFRHYDPSTTTGWNSAPHITQVGCLGRKQVIEPGGHVVPGWLEGCPGVHLVEALKPTENTTLSVSVFEDTDEDGLWDVGETAVQRNAPAGLVVRRTSASGPLLTSNSATYYDYQDTDLPPGGYTLFINPAIANLTKYSYRQIGGAPFSVGNYTALPAPSPYSRTASFNIVNGQTTKVNLGVQTLFPDYGIDSVTANDPLVVGSNISFSAIVRNKGTANAPLDGSGRFCIDATVASCYAVTNPIGAFGTTVGINPPLPVIGVGNTVTVNSTGGTWAATLGSHTITFCADIQFTGFPNGLIKELTEGSSDNCRTTTLSVSLSVAWVKTENGNVGSVGDITLGIWLPAGEHNAEYIVSKPIGSFFTSAKNWVLDGYVAEPKGPNTYGTLFKDLSGSSGCDLGGGITNIPNKAGKFIVSGNLTINGGYAGGASCPTLPSNKGAVVFVEGSLSIADNASHKILYGLGLATSRPTVFIVKGNITVNKDLTTLNAVFLNDGSFQDGTGNSELTVNGAIISLLFPDPTAIPAPQLRLQRDTGDLSEHIILQPSYFYYLTDYAGIANTYYKEENP